MPLPLRLGYAERTVSNLGSEEREAVGQAENAPIAPIAPIASGTDLPTDSRRTAQSASRVSRLWGIEHGGPPFFF